MVEVYEAMKLLSITLKKWCFLEVHKVNIIWQQIGPCQDRIHCWFQTDTLIY